MPKIIPNRDFFDVREAQYKEFFCVLVCVVATRSARLYIATPRGYPDPADAPILAAQFVLARTHVFIRCPKRYLQPF